MRKILLGTTAVVGAALLALLDVDGEIAPDMHGARAQRDVAAPAVVLAVDRVAVAVLIVVRRRVAALHPQVAGGRAEHGDQPGSTEADCVQGVIWNGRWCGCFASVMSNSRITLVWNPAGNCAPTAR